MKQAFGATLLFQIVIFFVVVFTAYICLSINQAKAFNVKNEILKSIEKHAPNLGSSIFESDIKEILENEGYRLNGDCDNNIFENATEIYGCDREGKCTKNFTNNVAFCIAEYQTLLPGSTTITASYYKVATFYQLDLPIFNNIFQLKTLGETKMIYKS